MCDSQDFTSSLVTNDNAYTRYSHKCGTFFSQEITRAVKLYCDRLLCIRNIDIVYADKWRKAVRGNRRSKRKLTSTSYCTKSDTD
jgi:hypothetical protein